MFAGRMVLPERAVCWLLQERLANPGDPFHTVDPGVCVLSNLMGVEREEIAALPTPWRSMILNQATRSQLGLRALDGRGWGSGATSYISPPGHGRGLVS